MFKKNIPHFLLQKIILILFFCVLCGISKLYSQSKESQSEWFPLSKGNYWIYKGIVKWQSSDSLDNIVVMEDTITFKMKVIDKANVGDINVYAMKGFPFLLHRYQPDQEKNTFYIAQKGFNKCYQADVKTFNLANKILAESKNNSSEKSEAEKIAHILAKLTLKKLLDENYLFLDFPLTAGKKIGSQSSVDREDNMNCWFVKESVKTNIENIKGLPVLKGIDKYILAYKTLPGGIEYDFVPGIGITRFRFKHMGTVSECDVRLIECSMDKDKNSNNYVSKYKQSAKNKREDLLFESAERINTVYSYKNILKKYPHTRYRDEINNLIKKLKQDWNPAIRDVETIYLKITESFPEGYNFPELKVEKEIKSIFENVFINIVTDDQTEADTVLNMIIKGEALGERYKSQRLPDVIGSYHYTGAIVSGEIHLNKIDGKKLFSLSFSNKIPVLSSISGKYSDPSEAPFRKAFKGSRFYRKIWSRLDDICNLPPSLEWEFNVQEDATSDPVFNNDILYVKSEDEFNNCYIYEIEPNDGTLIRKLNSISNMDSSPTVKNEKIYFGSDDHFIYSINAKDGSLNWKFMSENRIASSPAIAHKTVYIGSKDCYLYALDTQNGSLKWKYKTGGHIYYSPVVADSSVYICPADNYLYVFDAFSGRLKWKYKTSAYANSKPAVANGKIYFSTFADSIYALDTKDGKLQWKFKTEGWNHSSPVVGNSTVYIGSSDGYIYALDAINGTLKWKFKTADGIDSCPAVKNGTLYIGSNDSHIYAIDTKSGLLKWKFKTGGWVQSPFVVNSNIYVCSGAYVYALNADL